MSDTPEYEWQAVWIADRDAKGLRIELPCVSEELARQTVKFRLEHPRYPSAKAWVERRLKIKQPPWEVIE